MPRILVTRVHCKPLPEARSAIETVATGIAERFSIDYEWQGDTLHFRRAGVTGQIGVSPTLVEVRAEISFLMIPIQSAIEDEIVLHLEREFG